MDSLIIEVVSNASPDVYPNNTMASFTNFLPDQIELDGEWEVGLLEISYPAMYYNITNGKFFYQYDSKTEILYLQPGMYSYFEEIILSMNQLIRSNFNNAPSIDYKVDRTTGKVTITLARNTSLVLASNDLTCIFGFTEQRDQGIILTGDNDHEAPLPIDILRFHSMMIYSDIVEYNIVGDTKAPLLRCFPLMSKVRDGSLSITQYMGYRSFDKIQYKKLLKTSFHSVKIELRDTSGELIPFLSVGLTRLTLEFRKIPH